MSGSFNIPHALRPIRILQDGMDGKYSKGLWIAYVDNRDDRDDLVWNGSQAGYDPGYKAGDTRTICTERFWANEGQSWWIAVGDTPDDAVRALLAKALAK